jgi:hypothetical protein
MSPRWMVWSAWTDIFPEPVRGYVEGPLGIGVLILVGAIAVYILARLAGGLFSLFGGRESVPDNRLRENLAEYPPAPGTPGPRRLTIEGIPVRVRLLVVASSGKGNAVDADEVEGLLDGLIHGLGNVVAQDRPRIRVWPPQLSRQGFAPTFHRLTEKPEDEGRPSRWVLVAGHVSVGRRPFLLGMALAADAPCTLGRLTLDPLRWVEVLRIQEVPA